MSLWDPELPVLTAPRLGCEEVNYDNSNNNPCHIPHMTTTAIFSLLRYAVLRSQ